MQCHWIRWGRGGKGGGEEDMCAEVKALADAVPLVKVGGGIGGRRGI